MPNRISNKQKRDFLEYFMLSYNLKKREVSWILNYIAGNENVLDRVHFVEDAHNYDLSLVATTRGIDGIMFRFYDGEIFSSDIEKALHTIRRELDRDLYIQLNYENKPHCTHYALILEESYNSNDELSPEVLEEANIIMEDLKRGLLLIAIDVALDNGDQKLFMEMWEELSEIGIKYSSVG